MSLSTEHTVRVVEAASRQVAAVLNAIQYKHPQDVLDAVLCRIQKDCKDRQEKITCKTETQRFRKRLQAFIKAQGLSHKHLLAQWAPALTVTAYRETAAESLYHCRIQMRLSDGVVVTFAVRDHCVPQRRVTMSLKGIYHVYDAVLGDGPDTLNRMTREGREFLDALQPGVSPVTVTAGLMENAFGVHLMPQAQSAMLRMPVIQHTTDACLPTPRDPFRCKDDDDERLETARATVEDIRGDTEETSQLARPQARRVTGN